MKTISLELSKKLNEWWYLEGVETEYNWCFNDNWEYFIANSNKIEWIKTLTLEEAIEFLPRTHTSLKNDFRVELEWYISLYRLHIFTVGIWNQKWAVDYIDSVWKRLWIWQKLWETLLEAIEAMIEYLLDNNLLWKQ